MDIYWTILNLQEMFMNLNCVKLFSGLKYSVQIKSAMGFKMRINKEIN